MLHFTGNISGIATLQKIQATLTELLSVTYTQGNDQPTTLQKVIDFAKNMTKARNADTTMMGTMLKELEKKGGGGILSSLVGSLVGGFSPEAGKIISMIPV